MPKILVVDDDRGMRELLEIMLVQEGYEVNCASDGKQALKLCEKNKFDLVLTDLSMPRVDGIECLKNIKEISPETIVIIITAYASGSSAIKAMKEGAYDYIEKNFNIDDLKKVIHDALLKKGITKKDAQFIQEVKDADRFGKLIGKSKKMLKVYSLIKKVSKNNANVLILGESGTGKELVARAIHENSLRKNKPFVDINCGGIPDNLLESELFGYMKGSFTGASIDKPGLFEIGAEGTIFLDEIAELPILLQVKFLRTIQEKTFRRIGGSQNVNVDIRIIAATNQDILEKIKDGTFREDLYYRLNVIPIHIPPLRERKEDILLLTEYFIKKYSNEFDAKQINVSAYAMELLMDYRFPGNVRELENIIEKSVALETSNIFLPDDLSLTGHDEFDRDKILDMEIPEQGINLNDELARIERILIKKAMKKANGSKSKTAKFLNVSADSLRYRIEKLGIV